MRVFHRFATAMFLIVLAPACTPSTPTYQNVDFSYARALVDSEFVSLSDLQELMDGFDEQEYRAEYQIDQIEADCPIISGMTIEELDRALEANRTRNLPLEMHESTHFGFEKRVIRDGDGWIYFWVTGKAVYHLNICISGGRVKSVWVMPGNAEWFTMIYYRISGSGPRNGPNRIW